MASGLRAVIIGGSGNVGSKLVQSLLLNNFTVNKVIDDKNYSEILLISRRPLPEFENKEIYGDKIKIRVLNKLEDIENEEFKDYNCAYMLLGAGKPSTISKDELFHIDAKIPILFAKACKNNNIEHISVLSAGWADENATYSSITKTAAGGGWYNHCKGHMENEIKKLNFKSAVFYQPAAIYPGNTNTPETFGWLNEKLNCILPKTFVTVGSDVIAKSMRHVMTQQLQGKIQGNVTYFGGQAIRDIINA